MARRRLATAVHVDGQVFKAGDTPPKEIAAQITNAKAWVDDKADESQDADDSGSEGDTPADGDDSGSGDSAENTDDEASESQDSRPRRRRNK